MSFSINGRLLAAATAILVVFLGATGLALDRAFRQSTEAAARGHLQGQLWGLLAAAQIGEDGELTLPAGLAEARFSTTGSGLYAMVHNASGELWRSASLVGRTMAPSRLQPPGQTRFTREAIAGGYALYVLRFGVDWEVSIDRYRQYTFTVAEDTQIYAAQVESFRRTLWGWLLGLAAGLLLVQGLVMRWGLAPLRRVAGELSAIERGEQDTVRQRYPRELAALTGPLNRFITHERRHLKRYRDSLGDLAHSLKTPLAVLRGLLDTNHPAKSWRDEGGRQIARMSEIIDYQLQRASAAGVRTLAAPLALEPVVDKVLASLNKVYADKNVQAEARISPGAQFHGDEGDLMEILGNLLDNAFKYCRQRVRVSARAATGDAPGLHLIVEDDGPGFDATRLHELTARGVRADQRAEGQGLGLALVREIVEAFDGQLKLGPSPLGGGSVRVTQNRD